MTSTTSILHPSFTFNGLQFTDQELETFATKLQEDGYDYEVSIGKFIAAWLNAVPTLTVKTSGSTGKPKKIALQKSQMIASAKATGTFFNTGEGTKALLCLSADYIAGKMMLVRAMVLGWHLHVVAPEKDALTQYDNDYDFVAMVPYQVHHSLKALQKVKILIIGGGSVSTTLQDQLKQLKTKVYETYGMTETITHIAVKAINGDQAASYFKALPEVYFSLDDRGCLVIDAPTIASQKVVTNDVVQLISATAFSWLGRYDNVINSGGVKIHPELVEEKLAPFIDLPFIITSEPDEALGERVLIACETKQPIDKQKLLAAFTHVAPYEKPKRIITLSQFPYTETGKIKRKNVVQLINGYKK